MASTIRDHNPPSPQCDQQPFDLDGASDIGEKRSENQDRFLIADLQRMLTIRGSNLANTESKQLCSNRLGQLLVVADGMGGHAGGQVASTTAIELSARYVLDMMHWFLKLSDHEEDDFLDDLAGCLKAIQKRLWLNSDRQYDRMGTTVTMAYILWPRMYLVHAGDSRCYLQRNGELRQLTTDHTIAQKMVDEGALSPQDAETSRWRHVLWNCVGGGDKLVKPEVSRVMLEANDTVLLCSDGVTGMMADNEISQVLQATESSHDIVRELVSRANRAGGDDNITAVVARFPKASAELADTRLSQADDEPLDAALCDTDVIETP